MVQINKGEENMDKYINSQNLKLGDIVQSDDFAYCTRANDELYFAWYVKDTAKGSSRVSADTSNVDLNRAKAEYVVINKVPYDSRTNYLGSETWPDDSRTSYLGAETWPGYTDIYVQKLSNGNFDSHGEILNFCDNSTRESYIPKVKLLGKIRFECEKKAIRE